MAKIIVKNIETLMLNVLPMERTPTSKGDLAIHPFVAAKYREKGYDTKPTSPTEADARGEKSFNGLMSSLPAIRVYPSEGNTVIVADIAPTRYLIGEALRDLAKSGIYTSEDIKEMSPNMVGVSLVVPVKIKSQYFLLSQIKGKALGSGQIHAALVAGNIDAEYLQYENPLTIALQKESSEELGMDLSSLDPTSIVYIVDEKETGQINFAYVAKNANAINILTAYERNVTPKILKGEELEVMALAKLPVAGIALVHLSDGSSGLKDVLCYHPTAQGLTKVVEDRGVRPYTQATIDYLSKPENVKFLLEKAGF